MQVSSTITGRPTHRFVWPCAALSGTPATVLAILDRLGVPSNPHSITILLVPIAVLAGMLATLISLYWLFLVARHRPASSSVATVARASLLLVNAVVLAVDILPRMRW